jgi:hypothetical protein
VAAPPARRNPSVPRGLGGYPTLRVKAMAAQPTTSVAGAATVTVTEFATLSPTARRVAGRRGGWLVHGYVQTVRLPLRRLGGTPEAAGAPARQHAGHESSQGEDEVKDMSRNRHNVPRDETTRMVHSQACQADAYSWLRTLRHIRALVEIAA